MTTLLWLTGLIFAALLPWGTNVPLERRVVLVKVLIGLNIAVHLFTQGYMHQSSTSEWSSSETRLNAADAQKKLENYIDTFGITPGKLTDEGGWRYAQLITANFIHGGWLHLVMNLWLFSLYGQNLEALFGRWRFGAFMLAAMLGSQAAVLLFTANTPAFSQPHAGFSGVVYAVMGAYLVCFPRSKINVALIYDIKFWAAVLFLLLPGIFIFGSASKSLAELLLVLGVVILFALIQPDHARFGMPAFVLLGYKLLQDALTFERQIEEFHISIWSHMGGLMVGTVAGLLVNGTRGLHQTYGDTDGVLPGRKLPNRKSKLRKLEGDAHKDPEAARVYLQQRVFIGDAAGATKFYSEVVLKQFPSLVLEPRDLHQLGRMLEFKGLDAAALHAYEQLLRVEGLPAGHEDAYMQAAKLCSRLQPERVGDCVRYIDRFEELTPLMRDKFEARRFRTEILEAAKGRGLLNDIDVPVEPAPLPKAVAIGSKRLQPEAPALPPSIPLDQLSASNSAPPPVEPAVGEEVSAEAATPPNDPQGLPEWGKKALPLKSEEKLRALMRARAEEREKKAEEERNQPPPPETNAPPPLPKSMERRIGLREKRAPRVDLTNFDNNDTH